MKYIITESQNNRLWLLRRYDLVLHELKESIEGLDPCRFADFDDYEHRLTQYIMDGLHHEFYLMDNFDYEGMRNILKDLFYVDITEAYHSGKEKC
jgi:hypothetical protein